MHFRGAVLLVGLLTGTAIAWGAPTVVADPARSAIGGADIAAAASAAPTPAPSTPSTPSTPSATVAPSPSPAATPAPAPTARRTDRVTGRLAPALATAGERVLLAGAVSPVEAKVEVTVEQRDATGTWRAVDTVRTDVRGRYDAQVATDAVGSADYRAVVGAVRSRPATLRVTDPAACSPATAPVDDRANTEARCLLVRLDRWRKARLMGIGQQLNVSNKDYMAPLERLRGERVAVVGFDLEELAAGQTYQFPVPPLDGLLGLAEDGAVLSASWHVANPFGGSPVRLRDLLDEETAAGRTFWQDYDDKLALLKRFQDGDGGRFAPAPVVFRPFHEANGNWFWYGQPDPDVYQKLWLRLQERAWDAGLHHVVWAFSGNRRTSAAVDPGPLVPRRADLGGLDTYDPERGKANTKDKVWLEGYDAIRTRSSRIALTEVGPHGSTGAWKPSVITRTVRAKELSPLWALLWFDDGQGYRDDVLGDKQISSLRGGTSWLATCPNGLCATR